jgi:hypothetical protein
MLFQKVGCPWFILLDQKVTTVLRYSRSTRVLTVNFIQISHQYQVKSMEFILRCEDRTINYYNLIFVIVTTRVVVWSLLVFVKLV